MLSFSFLSRPSDIQIAQILALYRAAGWWGAGPDDPDLVYRLVAGSHCFLTVVAGDAIIAMGRAISDRASDAYIQDVFVTPDYRQEGLGTRIIETLYAKLKGDGIGWIGLVAENGSHGFYRRLGFSPMPNAVPMLKTR